MLVHNCPGDDSNKKGKLGELATHQKLKGEGHTEIVEQVTFLTRDGVEFRADFVSKGPDGKWVATEAKNGPRADRTDGQDVGYPELQDIGAKLMDDRLEGLKMGTYVRMRVEVDIWKCTVCGK